MWKKKVFVTVVHIVMEILHNVDFHSIISFNTTTVVPYSLTS